MGVAAYWRGSKAISDGLARDAYREGRGWLDPDRLPPKPTPRPADWGDKTAEKAAQLVSRRLAIAKQIADIREEPFVWSPADTQAAVDQLAERHRIGRSTLRDAFSAALRSDPA